MRQRVGFGGRRQLLPGYSYLLGLRLASLGRRQAYRPGRTQLPRLTLICACTAPLPPTNRNLPPGTLSGLDALCDHAFWLNALRQAEVGISNEDIFRFRFQEICKAASSRLAFLAGSGEYTSFNLRYLITQLVEQCEGGWVG